MTNYPETLVVNSVVLDSETHEEIFSTQMIMVNRETLEASVGHADNVYNEGERFYTVEYKKSEEAHSYGETYGVAYVIHFMTVDKIENPENEWVEEEQKSRKAVNLIEAFREEMYSDR